MKNKILLIMIAALTLGACNTTKTTTETFTVDMRSPQVQIGEIETQIDGFLSSGVKKLNTTVLYFPQEDAVCVQYKLEFTTYSQFWSRKGRDAFMEALIKYNEDYSARNLSSKGGRKAKRQYGTITGYLVWQMFSFSIQAKANMDVELGYAFKDRSPYFCVNQRAAEYEDPHSRDNNRTSQATPMYFTRAQAQELAALFDQQFLNSASIPQARINADSGVDADDYNQ